MVQRRDNARIAPLALWDVPSPRPATERESGPKVWEISELPSDLYLEPRRAAAAQEQHPPYEGRRSRQRRVFCARLQLQGCLPLQRVRHSKAQHIREVRGRRGRHKTTPMGETLYMQAVEKVADKTMLRVDMGTDFDWD